MARHADNTAETGIAGWRRILALHSDMVDFDLRGFRTEPVGTRATLEAAANAFLTGFNTELGMAGQAPDLSSLPEHRRGFAAEGATMAATMLDCLNPTGGRRLAALHGAYANRYIYLMYVGSGWAMAKLHRTRLRSLGANDPLLRWLAYDGMGFCQAFFATEQRLGRWYRPHDGCDATCNIRYQGLGRSLWFRECGCAAGLAARVRQLPEQHRADAWSGIALAATYAGGVEPDVYADLRRCAGPQAGSVAQGAAFGAEAWRCCGHVPPHAHTAVQALAGVSVQQAASWTWQARAGLDRPGASSADYERWRAGIQQLAAEHAYH
jgi:hypothetical protein